MGNLCKITLGPVAIILTSLALGQRGPVLILATFFSFAEKLAGTSFGIQGDIWDGVEGIGFTISGGQVIGSIGMVIGSHKYF